MKPRCEIVIGALVAHPCAQPATLECVQCGASVCGRHVSRKQKGTCVRCAKELLAVDAIDQIPLDDLLAFDDDETARFDPHHDASLHDFDS